VSTADFGGGKLSAESISKFASTATSGLAGAAGIVKLQEFVVELFVFGIGPLIALRAILRSGNGARRWLLCWCPFSLHAAECRSRRRQGQIRVSDRNVDPGYRECCESKLPSYENRWKG
jgi:hypothetical protein